MARTPSHFSHFRGPDRWVHGESGIDIKNLIVELREEIASRFSERVFSESILPRLGQSFPRFCVTNRHEQGHFDFDSIREESLQGTQNNGEWRLRSVLKAVAEQNHNALKSANWASASFLWLQNAL